MSFVPLKHAEPYKPGVYDNGDGLVDWQAQDIQYLLGRTYSANWSEMGCFKTTTALWWLDPITRKFAQTNITPISLIVTTKSGKGTYFDAIPKSVSGYQVFDVQSTKAQEIASIGDLTIRTDWDLGDFNSHLHGTKLKPIIVLTHYNSLLNNSKVLPILKSIVWASIVVDEAHKMKNRNTQWTRNLKMFKTLAGHKHAMTGTGFINRPDEIWSILNFLAPKEFSSYWKFRKYFCDEFEVNGYTVILGIKEDKLEEFRTLRKTIGVRRMMREVHSTIEEPIFTPRMVDLNVVQRKMYDEIKKELRAMDQKGERIDSPNVLSQLNRLRQICVATPDLVRVYYDPIKERKVQEVRLIEPSTKLDELMDLLADLEWDADEKQQVVVFSNFKDPLELLKVRLDTLRQEAEAEGRPGNEWSYIHMEQKHTDDERYKLWHDVWPKKEHRIFMSTLQLGSESINLSSASHVVFLDRSWSPKDNVQGVSRLFRPGQKDITQVIHINARRTTDQRIENANLIKMGWFNDVFGDEEDEDA